MVKKVTFVGFSGGDSSPGSAPVVTLSRSCDQKKITKKDGKIIMEV